MKINIVEIESNEAKLQIKRIKGEEIKLSPLGQKFFRALGYLIMLLLL